MKQAILQRAGRMGRFLMALIVLTAVTTPVLASEDETETNGVRIPVSVEAGLSRLLTMLPPEGQSALDLTAATEVINFVLSSRATAPIAHTQGALPDPSAYYPFDLQLPLSRFLQIAYNPDIPSAMVMPESVRLSRWDAKAPPMPKLWQHLDTLTAPVIAKGAEYIVNTPDPNSGAYFAYDLNRVMILFNHDGKRVFFSLSRQPDRSDVGKKGVAVGNAEQWDFLYTGQKGLTLAGLGWISSYMYDSYSLSVFIEPDAGRPLVHAGIFKWIRAGWSSINMVKRSHIHSGLERHVRNFKSIVEHPSLPPVAEMVAANRQILQLDRKQLNTLFSNYLERLSKSDLDGRSRRWLKCLREDDGYIDGLTTEELQAVAAGEYIKHVLGRIANPGLLAMLRPS